MKKMINRITVEGIHYDNDLKKSEKGYVNGKLSILIPNGDEQVQNICDMRVIAGAKYGNKPDAKTNFNFPKYCELMDSKEKNCFMAVGEEAIGVSITGSFEPNYFCPKGRDQKRENVISGLRNGASFIDLMPANMIEQPRAEFEVDIVITNIAPEMTKDECPAPTGNYIVKGYVFNYKGAAIEVSMIAKASQSADLSAADYFAEMAMDVNEGTPVFTKVWGRINGFITTVEKEEKSAFGESKVVSFKNTKRELEITGALPVPYEEGLTKEEFEKALKTRELEIATALDRSTEKTTTNTASPTESIASAFGNLGGMGGKFQF